MPPPPSKAKLRDKVLHTIQTDTSLPAFSATAQKLMSLASKENCDMQEVVDLVKLDPGLSGKYLRLSNSVAFGGKSITSIDDALLRIGLGEVRKLAAAIGVMDKVGHLKVKVDWKMFWLHSILTARLTERLASAYREVTGKEYLAGLLHDVGKLFLEHYFPTEFETIMIRAVERGCGMFAVEDQLYDITHAEVGWALCEQWKLHREIGRSIRFHHQPNSPFNKDTADPEMQQLLSACILVADTLANICKVNMQGAKKVENVEISTLPEWVFLQQFPTKDELKIDVSLELEKAQEAMGSVVPG